jgi:predicted adenylyl cyclase CyaB
MESFLKTVVWIVCIILVIVLAFLLRQLARSKQYSGGGALEIERVYFDFDEAEVKSKIMEAGGHHKGKYLFRHVRFAPPPGDAGHGRIVRVRVRDEGHRVTMTVKRRFGNDKYDKEDEAIINDFNKGVGLLESLGFRKMYYLEKTRDIYTMRAPDNAEAEIVFDTYPGLPACLEIEAPTEAAVLHTAALLGLRPGEDQTRDAGDMYLEHYGITKDRPLTDLTFENASAVLGPLVTKNREEFYTRLSSRAVWPGQATGAPPTAGSASGNQYPASLKRHRP